MQNLKHWLPLVVAALAFCVGGFWGGPVFLDGDGNVAAVEINLFDWLAALMAVGSAASIRFLIPEDRGRLRVFSMIIAVIICFHTVSGLMSLCVAPPQMPPVE